MVGARGSVGVVFALWVAACGPQQGPSGAGGDGGDATDGGQATGGVDEADHGETADAATDAATDDAADAATDDAADAADEDTGSDGAPLDYSACDDPPQWSPDAIDDPDTDAFADLLRDAIADGGYGEHAEVVTATMVENNAVRFCAHTSLRIDWFADVDFECFEKGTDEEMAARFAEYVASFAEVPDALITLEALEAAANGCHADIYEAYVPCRGASGGPSALTMQFGRERGDGDCLAIDDRVTVDLVTGAVTECVTEEYGICSDDDSGG